MGFENVCIACLATDVKMYNLNKLFHNVYSNLTGITSIDDSNYICFECTHMLLKIDQFRSQCLRAHETLTRTEHAQDRTTWHHEPRLKLTETKVLYFGPDQIVLSDTDADDNDVKEAKPFHSGLIHAIKSDTDAQVHTYDTVLKSERNNIHVNPLNIQQNAVFIQPAISQLKVEFESDFNHSEFVDRFACDIKTQDTINIEDKIKLKSVKKEGKSRPARKRQIKGSQKNNLNKETLDRNKQIREIMTIAVQSPEDAKKEIEMRRQSHKYETSTFKCNLCFKVFNHQRTLSNHMKKHNNDFIHECDYCNIKAKTRIMLKEHIIRTHMYKFTCKRCPYVCSARVQAMSHIRQHTGDISVCKICGKTFKHAHTLAIHMRASHISELSEVVCEMCGDIFISKNGLNGHIRLSHSGESLPRSGPACAPCGARFCSDAAYRRHLVLSTKHHVSNGCSRCGDTFPDEEALRRHVRETHPETTRKGRLSDLRMPDCNGCAQCGETFIDEVALKRHFREVHPDSSQQRRSLSHLNMPTEWPAPCPECSVILNSRKEYRQHILAVHPTSARARRIRHNDKKTAAKNHVCEVCGLGFTAACYLSYHMCTHTGVRPHACEHCTQSFASPAELKLHQRVHQPRQVCADCGNTFADVYSLRKHRRVVHLKILPHNCSQCDKKFHDRCALKYHMRHVHEKVPWPTINRKTRRPRKDDGKRPRREYHDSGDSSTN